MNVIIYFTASYPYGNASTNRVHQIAKGLLENDVKVNVVITNPTERNKNTLNVNSKGSFEGVNYNYISNSTYRCKNIFFRKLIDIYCYLKLYLEILLNNKKSDFIILIGGAFFDFRIIIPFLTKFSKAKILLEINEYPFVNEKKGLVRTLKNDVFFKIMISLFDGFIVISDALSELLEQHNVVKSKITKISILHEKVVLQNTNSLNINTPFIIHSGSIFTEDKDGMLGCLKAFKLAKEILNQDIKYIIATNNVTSSDIVIINHYIQNNSLNNDVIFVGNLSKYELIKFYNEASLAIINKADSVQNVSGFATKISEYVAYKIPLILTSVGEINNYFVNDYNAIIIQPNDYKLLSEKIVLLLNDTNKAKLLAENAFKLSETVFNPKLQAKQLVDFFSTV